VRNARMLVRALGVERAVVQDVSWDGMPGSQTLLVRVRPRKKEGQRCPHCGRRCSRYDQGAGLRRWRAPDVGLCPAYIVAEAPRVRCREHGVVVQSVPWARHGSKFTTAFEDQVAWLAVRTDKTTLSGLLKIAWRSVGRILERVAASMKKVRDPFGKVTRIGIDEVSYRKGHRYLTIVVDHDTGRLLWASAGRDEKNLRTFFDLLGPERCSRIRFVSCDAAAWIHNVVRERCPDAVICLDPFHVVQWATKALDEVRRSVWNELRKSGQKERAKALKGARWALWKNHGDLKPSQRATLAAIERDNQQLFRAYLLKEELRSVFQEPNPELAKLTLDDWLRWASRSHLPAFVKLARSIRNHRAAIDDVIDYGLSNARLEAANTKLRLLTRLAFGFHSSAPLIALAMLRLGGLCPPLPARP
jgi:transposase